MQSAESRKDTIGASEIAALFDCSPYESRYSLWCKKTGLTPPEPWDERTTRQQIGIDLERPILEIWAKREGLTARHNTHSKRSAEHPGLSATPDGFVWSEIEGGDPCVADVKTVRSTERKAWLAGIPEHYRWQVQQQTLVTGAPAGWLIALFGVDEISATRIEADKSAHLRIIEAADIFWRQIRGEISPPTIDDHRATLAAIMSQRRESKTIELSPEALEIDDRLRASERAMTELKKQIRADKALLLRQLGDADRGVWPNGVGYGVRLESRRAHEVKACTFQKLYRFANVDAEDGEDDE